VCKRTYGWILERTLTPASQTKRRTPRGVAVAVVGARARSDRIGSGRCVGSRKSRRFSKAAGYTCHGSLNLCVPADATGICQGVQVGSLIKQHNRSTSNWHCTCTYLLICSHSSKSTLAVLVHVDMHVPELDPVSSKLRLRAYLYMHVGCGNWSVHAYTSACMCKRPIRVGHNR
jgi:hypothetical protein